MSEKNKEKAREEWKVGYRDRGHGRGDWAVLREKDSVVLAEVKSHIKDVDPRKNAYILAASLGALRVLEEVNGTLRYLRSFGMSDPDALSEEINRIEAILSKARGRSR